MIIFLTKSASDKKNYFFLTLWKQGLLRVGAKGAAAPLNFGQKVRSPVND